MPRIARHLPAGYAYHVLNRGVGGMQLFADPADYRAFEATIAETLACVELRICSFCIMPNHWHFVVWPRSDSEVAEFFHRLTVTHATSWRRFRGQAGLGHVYQGRFKSFPVQDDDHFYRVVRYVERNPMRAGLVRKATDWRWSSLWIRIHGSAAQRARFSEWPVPMPTDWSSLLEQPQSEEDLAAIRCSVARGIPLGVPDWVADTACHLGLEATLRPRGRPAKNGTGPFSRRA